jgi:phosphonopyruvate decarboxylase
MKAKDVLDTLHDQGIDFVTGVPDSIFKTFLSELDKDKRFKHRWATNEGEAIGLATGYYLGSGKPALVYMQNSGLGNCVDPLTSLTNVDVYKIPMILFIGWRGEPGIQEESQHIKMGLIQDRLLKLLRIGFHHVTKEITTRGNYADRVTFEDYLRLTINNSKHEGPKALTFSKGSIE